MEIHKVIKRKQLHKTSVKLHCKTARIFAYSSTPVREHAVKQNVWNEAQLARFARVRLLRHASPISLLILRKKPDCFAVYGKTDNKNVQLCFHNITAKRVEKRCCAQARIHTGFHRFTEIGQIFHNKYIFDNKKHFLSFNLDNILSE